MKYSSSKTFCPVKAEVPYCLKEAKLCKWSWDVTDCGDYADCIGDNCVGYSWFSYTGDSIDPDEVCKENGYALGASDRYNGLSESDETCTVAGGILALHRNSGADAGSLLTSTSTITWKCDGLFRNHSRKLITSWDSYLICWSGGYSIFPLTRFCQYFHEYVSLCPNFFYERKVRGQAHLLDTLNDVIGPIENILETLEKKVLPYVVK